ncbi:MAG TPA: hypothetical protein DCS67_03865 [Clostridiales bacterium UBA8960]|jgi:hypothetical protein|nr:hypothetical protein [Clostridiales bacterium UBA8960]
MAKKEISEERKVLYYAGMIVTGIGVVLFMSTFFTFMNPDRFLMGEVSMGSFMTRPLIGFIMIAVGGFMRTVAARGVAGSGLVLDPKKAREDLSPWSTMAGGMINDALGETKLGTNKEVIKVRCQKCSALNDEDAKYCKDCGGKL